jgi:hypothetical protein
MHYIAIGIAALKKTTWQRVDAHRLVDALVQALRHLKITRESIDTIASTLLDRAMYSEAYALVTASYGTVPERFRLLSLWDRAVRTGSPVIAEATRTALLDRVYRRLLFALAREWEELCGEVLKVSTQTVVSAMENTSTLTNGLRPDFAYGEIERDAAGRIVFADEIADAKKSVLAITDDVDAYQPFCRTLSFLILDDEPRFVVPRATLIFASELISTVPAELAAKIRALQEASSTLLDTVERRYRIELESLEEALRVIQ